MRPQIVEHRLQDQLLYPLDSVPLTPTTGPSTMALFIALQGSVSALGILQECILQEVTGYTADKFT